MCLNIEIENTIKPVSQITVDKETKEINAVHFKLGNVHDKRLIYYRI